MKYLFYYKGSNNPKNKLESEVYEYLKQGDRLPFDDTSLLRTQGAILHQVNNLNHKYNRCTPVKLKFQEQRSGDISLFIGSGDTSPFNATFLKVAQL
jgi:hypothetical protein